MVPTSRGQSGGNVAPIPAERTIHPRVARCQNLLLLGLACFQSLAFRPERLGLLRLLVQCLPAWFRQAAKVCRDAPITLEFKGPRPCLCALEIAKADVPTVFILWIPAQPH